MNSEKQTRRKQQRGVAMVMALLAVFVLAIIGMAFMAMTITENSANRNYKDSQKAYFASRAGLENVRALLWTDVNFQTQVAGLAMPNPNPLTPGIIYALNPAGAQVIDPKANPTLDDELCQEQFVNLVANNLTPGTPGAPCGTGAATELMTPASTYYKTAAVVPIPAPLTLPDIALAPGDIPGTNTASALPFQWVRITNKQNLMGLMNPPQTVDGTAPGGPTSANQVCWDGTQEVVMAAGISCAAWNAANALNQANPVWVLTSLAIAPGGSRRMTQMEVAFTPPVYPPGTISTKAPVNLQGSYSIQSYDNCTCTSTTTGSGNNTVTTYGVSRPGKTCNMQAHVIATNGSVSVNGNSGTVISNYGTTAQSASVVLNPWPYDTNQLINKFKSGAQNAGTTAPWNYSCNGTVNFSAMPPQYANCGTQTGQGFGTFPPNLVSSNGSDNSGVVPNSVYIPGSVKLTSDANGAGILIVDGDLEINGGMNFYGLILVRGKVSFTGGGSQAVNIYGAILAGEDVSATDQAMTDNFGGSINFKYDTCALNDSAPPGPPKLLATHEVMY
jgi:hypothetical protein